jgi:CRISPR-associated protein Csb1
MSTTAILNPATLLADASLHRVTLQASLVPLTGDRFQPAGFPEIGHVIYKAPRSNRTSEDVCIVDSAASMANHLEAICHAGPFGSELHDDLAGLPYVACVTDGTVENGARTPNRLVVTSLSEGHRLASSYFLSDKAVLVLNGQPGTETFISTLLTAFGLQNLGTKTHPLPDDWWRIFQTIFRYDPNSLVHGILFPSLGIKISRVLTAHHEALGATRVGSSGVKFDKLGKTTSGQPIFAVDEETAREILATFVIDLSLIRSFGRGNNKGLTDPQKAFLLSFAFWKIAKLLAAPFRFRSNCDLRLQTIAWLGGDRSDPAKPKDRQIELSDISSEIATAIGAAGFDTGVTKVYWPPDELFKPSRDETNDDAAATDETGEDAPEGDEEEPS